MCIVHHFYYILILSLYLTEIGKLRQKRNQHSAIYNGREIMIVGGQGSMITEVWDRNFSYNRAIEPTLQDYKFYPIMHMVPYNFGT